MVACVKRGVEASGEDDKDTLYSVEERSGMTLEKLVDSPDELILALRNLLGVGSVPVLDSIRRELLLSSVGHAPVNGRIEAFLLTLSEAKGFTEP